MKSNDIYNVLWSLVAPEKFELVKTNLAPPCGRELQIEFLYCGLCGSDLSTFEGRRSRQYPLSLGHEFVGKIVDTGDDTADFSIGNIVVSDFNYRCGNCSHCRAKRSHLCEFGQESKFSNRAFSRIANVNSNYLTKVPDAYAKPEFCLVEPLSCVVHAFNHADICKDSRILVVGAGSLGMCMAFILIEKNITADYVDPMDIRLRNICSNLFPKINRQNSSNGCEYDLVFDLSGSCEGLRTAIDMVRKGGRLISMSHLDGYGETDFVLPMLTRRDITFTVSYLNGEKENMLYAAEIIKRNWTADHSKMLAISPITQLPKMFSDRRDSNYNKDVFDLSIW